MPFSKGDSCQQPRGGYFSPTTVLRLIKAAKWSKENLAAIVVPYVLTYLLVDNMTTKNSTVKLITSLLCGNALFYTLLIANRRLARGTSTRQVFLETLREFGWPEFFDWVPIRPAILFLCVWLMQSDAQGSALGHGVADLIFYKLGFSHAGLKMTEAAGSLLARIGHHG